MNRFDWCVVGAGPAGISAIGKLLDEGVSTKKIAWIDPLFNVGDLGSKWQRVHGNTKVKYLKLFLSHCNSFDIAEAPRFKLYSLNEHKACLLADIVEPLAWITQRFIKRVNPFTDTVHSLSHNNHHWYLELAKQTIVANQVILATGSIPKTLPSNKPVIPLDVAMNDEKLAQLDLSQQTIGVYGSSHSAIVVMKNLLDGKVKKVVNFYRQPIKYALFFDEFILFDNTGLKDYAADWAREHIDGQWPDRLERVHCASDDKDQKLEQCDSVIFCIGFEKRDQIKLSPYKHSLPYNEGNGIIAPGLFGLGIAYPCRVTDPFGNVEHNVGLNKFMCHLDHVLPIWLQYKA
ncbi:FAD-dependent oxidoreductase [Shewanella sp. 202IG2-18]|uniref:FAD-dependent oxidoreductase n=1 Tax=Parashewanella hymeniacidonis TaxID=2807618 RepID=UPI001961E924|nr:FAD-dependent oxidoreductase [Parashewanella hymeniacidonis]MBM7072245.1 FAD-dependent oxidoreductase [Parashewanella hymeniacidonis]